MGGIENNDQTKTNRLLFKRAASKLLSIGHQTALQIGKPFTRERLPETLLLLSPLLAEPIVFRAANIDHNFIRQINTVVYPLMPVVMTFTAQGTKPPAGKTPWAKWYNAVKSPNQSTMYFSFAALMPVGVLNIVSNLGYGLFGGRPEQLGQAALTTFMMGSMARSLFKQALKTEDPQAYPAPIANPPTGVAGKILKLMDDKLASRHAGIYLQGGMMGMQLIEAAHLMLNREYARGGSMLTGLGFQAVVVGINKLYMERQWAKSEGKAEPIARGFKFVRQTALAAQLVTGRDRRPSIRPVLQLCNQFIPSQRYVRFAAA